MLTLSVGVYQSYQWFGPNGFSSQNQNPVVTSQADPNIHAGVYTVMVTSAGGCTYTSTVSVTVNPRPVPYIISQSNVSCNGGSDGEVTVGSSGTAPFTFNWGFGNYTGATANITGLNAQSFNVNVVDNNSCISNPDLPITITEPSLLTVNPTYNGPPLYVGQSLMLTPNASGGTLAYGYQWSGPNGFSSTDASPVIPNITKSNAGIYTVTVTDNNGCQTVAQVNVNVQPPSTATLSGNSSICLSQSATVTLTFTGTGPFSGTVSDGVNNVNFGPTNNLVENISVTPTLAGIRTYTITSFTAGMFAGSFSGTAIVTVSTALPANTVGFVNSPVSACNGTVALVTANTVSGQNIQYGWNTGTSSSGVLFSDNMGGPFVAGPFVTNTNQVYVQYGALGVSSSGYNICVQGFNGCGTTNNKCNWTRGTVTVPAGITGPAVQCSGATGQLYNVTLPLPAGVETFIWTFSVPGAVITPLDPPLNSQVSINFPAFSTGTLSVQAGLLCLGSSTSAARSLTLSNSTTTPAIPSGPAKVCPGNSYVYQVPAVAGAASYNWNVPANATIISGAGTNTITVLFNSSPIYFSNGQISVTTVSVCGSSSASASKSVSSMVPPVPGNISGPATAACNGPGVYSVPVVAGVNYLWSWPTGVTNNSPNGLNSISLQFPNNFSNGTVSVSEFLLRLQALMLLSRLVILDWGSFRHLL